MKRRVLFLTIFIMLAFSICSVPHAECATVREVVCSYVNHMANIKWTPSKTFAYCNDISKIFRTGKTYVGMPYTNKNVKNLKSFREKLKYSDTGIPLYTGPADGYIGTDNAGAILNAWSEISDTVKFKSESDMFPICNTGTLAVGNYNYSVGKTSTAYIVSLSDDDTMLESYAALNAGDAVFTYIPDVISNSKLVTQVNVIKTSSGKINAEKSTVIVTEQVGFKNITSNTTWSIGNRYTFIELLTDGYIPITCKELKESDGVIEPPVIYVEDFEGGKHVSISCRSENAVIYYTTDGTTPSKNSTRYSGKITLTSSANINALAISGTSKSHTTARTVTVPESTAPEIVIADFIMGKIVTASASGPDTVIYYSKDDYSFEKYTSPFIVERSTVIRLYAVKFGCKRSKTVQKKITLKTLDAPTVISNKSTSGGRKITLSCTTPDTEFYYTVDGTLPYEDSKSFKSSIVIASSCTLNIRAMKSGMGASDSISINVNLPAVQTPELTVSNFIGGKKVTLTCNTKDVKMYYTTDGTKPKITDELYTAPLYIKENSTVRIIAVKDGYEAAYTERKISVSQVSIPIVKINNNMRVTISCKTSGALMYYTLDGSKPNRSSYRYKGSFSVKKGTVIKVYALRNGMCSSSTVNITANGAMTTESTMILSDYNYPTVLDYGQSYNIKGTLTSNYMISSVTVGVYSENGRKISEITELTLPQPPRV